MRNFIAVLLCAWLLAPASFAQPKTPPSAPATTPAAPQAPEKVTYLLIDASGSMWKFKAEETISEVLKETNAKAWISRTYFRAADREACKKPVEIGEPVPADQSVPVTQTYHADDFTPLGEALRAAIMHAVRGRVEATIYLVSDEEQTAGCGVDVCTVANALLPIDGITVKAAPVFGTDAVYHGSTNQAHDDGRQGKRDSDGNEQA